MGEIARAVGIGPSALYRHFTGKQELLQTVVEESIVPVATALSRIEPMPRSMASTQLAEIAMARRDLAQLWQREAKNLDAEASASVERRLQALRRSFVELVRGGRPDLDGRAVELLTFALSSVLASVSFHRLEPSGGRLEAELGAMVDSVWAMPVPPAGSGSVAAAHVATELRIRPSSRREQALAAAIELFAQRGYAHVGIEDIASAIGVAGPSLYNHFQSKAEILDTALGRGNAVLFMNLTTIMESSLDPEQCLARLLDDYLQFARDRGELISLLMTESRHLPLVSRRRVMAAQLEYVAEWTSLLVATGRVTDPLAARARVHAALAVANASISRGSDFQTREHAFLEQACRRLVHLE